jgi:hypothetical protein
MINDASLVMIPSGYKDGTLYSVKPTNGDGDFTFSRGSNLAATRVNSEGLIEKGRENLLLQSNTFDTTWSLSNGTLTGGQTGYDGSSDAWEFDASGTAQVSQSVSTSGVHTYSVYAKAGTENGLFLRANGGLNPRCFFNLDSGTIGSEAGGLIDSKMVDVGNGWYRCSILYSDTTNEARIYVSNNSGGFPTSGSIYIQDAQLEQGLVATDYIETTTTTAQAGILEDMSRLDYSGGSCPSLLLEPQRTNLISNSEYTDGANWSNEGSIVDEENTSETASPEGVYNAVKLVSANATSEQWLQANSISVTSGNDCTISCFVKKSDYDYFHIRFTGVGGAFSAGSVWFNIADGSVGTIQSGSGIIADIEDYGNGWYRISATKEVVATASASVRFQLASSDNQTNVVGDGSKGTYIYGCQAELGSYPSSYIPTYGSSVTRSADSCYKTGISSLIGQTEGTLFAELSALSNDLSYRSIGLNSGSATNRLLITFNNVSNNINFLVQVGGVTQVSMNYSSADITSNLKITFAYKENDFVAYVNGSQVGTDTSGSTYTSGTLTTFSFDNAASADKMIGKLNQAILFPTRLSNDELAALTS